MKVIVSQYGARRRYMIPRILEEAGLLLALYTDSNSQSNLGKIGKCLKNLFPSLSRLAKRQPDIPVHKIHSYDGLQVKLALCNLMRNSIAAKVETIYEGSSSKYIKWGVQDADWLYTMFIENIKFTQYAKIKGLKIIADIYEDPYIWDELLEELKHPAYSAIHTQQEFYAAQASLRHRYFDTLLAISDQYIVPSDYVKERIKKSPSFDAKKINLIPYPSSVRNLRYCNEPVIGRIIWVGNDPVRKGLIYCAEVARRIKEKYSFIDFRIIGTIPNSLKSSKYFSDLNFIGYCDKLQLAEEYRKADVFVFPTLAEGFAGGLLEAANFGVPIITTRASGLGVDSPGLFVEKRDVDGIVQYLTSLFENRALRTRISHDIFAYTQKRKDDFIDKLLKIIHTK